MDRRNFALKFSLAAAMIMILELQAAVDTRLNLVSNIHNSPELGEGTLIIDVEAIYTQECIPAIRLFQDAFKLDETLSNEVLMVSFSEQLFPAQIYFYEEGFDRDLGRIKYRYLHGCGTMSTILSEWTVIVRITIIYTMRSGASSISWYEGCPEFLVIDHYCHDITGIEYPIPFDLKDIPLPVTLSSFEAVCGNGEINLTWKVESEVNNMGFEILRANGGEESFQNISSYKYNPALRSLGNSTTRQVYSFSDNSVCNGQLYRYKLIDVDTKGNLSSHGPIFVQANFGGLPSISAISPADYQLYQNYPNPFNPHTTFRFDIPLLASGMLDAKLLVFNSLGHLVKAVYQGKIGGGTFEVQWDGLCENGLPASSGIYFGTLQIGNYTQTIKMTLLK